MNAVYLYRLGRYAHNFGIPFVPKLIETMIQFIFSCRVPSTCALGPGTKLAYGGIGVLVVANARFGSNCSIGVGVKVIRKFPYKSVPVFGDNVFIGPGAVVCGPVVIGDNAIVAPNAVVLHSVPAGAIVGGIPAVIIGRVADLDYHILDNAQDKSGTAAVMKDK